MPNELNLLRQGTVTIWTWSAQSYRVYTSFGELSEEKSSKVNNEMYKQSRGGNDHISLWSERWEQNTSWQTMLMKSFVISNGFLSWCISVIHSVSPRTWIYHFKDKNIMIFMLEIRLARFPNKTDLWCKQHFQELNNLFFKNFLIN